MAALQLRAWVAGVHRGSGVQGTLFVEPRGLVEFPIGGPVTQVLGTVHNPCLRTVHL